MNRRELLIRSGQAALALAIFPGFRLAAPAARPVSLNGKLYKGTARGEILESADNGQKWQRTAFFGPNRPVLGLWSRDARLYAQVGVDRFSFYLVSADGQGWHTATAVPKG